MCFIPLNTPQIGGSKKLVKLVVLDGIGSITFHSIPFFFYKTKQWNVAPSHSLPFHSTTLHQSKHSLREITLKQKIAARHNKKVIKREFEVGDLVLRRNQKDPEEGKLVANWEGPYRITMKTGKGAYDLEDLIKGAIPTTWNAEKLKRYYT